MNLVQFLNLASGTAANGANAGKSQISLIVMMVLLFGVMYFVMIRPQKKKQKEEQKEEQREKQKEEKKEEPKGSNLDVNRQCFHFAVNLDAAVKNRYSA